MRGVNACDVCAKTGSGEVAFGEQRSGLGADQQDGQAHHAEAEHGEQCLVEEPFQYPDAP